MEIMDVRSSEEKKGRFCLRMTKRKEHRAFKQLEGDIAGTSHRSRDDRSMSGRRDCGWDEGQ